MHLAVVNEQLNSIQFNARQEHMTRCITLLEACVLHKRQRRKALRLSFTLVGAGGRLDWKFMRTCLFFTA